MAKGETECENRKQVLETIALLLIELPKHEVVGNYFIEISFQFDIK